MTASSSSRHLGSTLMLPAPFVHATLIALDLPRDLADRYANPFDPSAAREVDREGYAVLPADFAPPAGAAAWPFPTAH